eukprot:2569314-Amphidinium_carterae.1
MPLNWSLNGVYKLTMEGSERFITDRSKLVKLPLKHRALRSCTFEELYISQNFSNVLAVILSARHDSVNVKCASFFYEIEQAMSPSSKKRASETGSTEKGPPPAEPGVQSEVQVRPESLPERADACAADDPEVQTKRVRLSKKQKASAEQPEQRPDADSEVHIAS